MAYKSTVMLCNVGDDDCAICRFLNCDDGKPALADMMEVILVLDLELAREQECIASLVKALEARRESP